MSLRRELQEPAPTAAGKDDANPVQKTPATPSLRQALQASKARRTALQRDRQQARNFNRDPRTTSRERKSVSSSLFTERQSSGRRFSLTGGPLRQTPERHSISGETTDPATAQFPSTGSPVYNAAFTHPEQDFEHREPSQTEEQRTFGSAHHGYSRGEWSKELDELNPPTLLLSTPEALLDFKIAWLNYSEKLGDIAAKQHRYIPPKSVYDCIEKHNRIYICGVSNLLPPELQGHPTDVSHVVLHDLVMNEGAKQESARTTQLTSSISKITINLEGRTGAESIHAAWIKLSTLEEKYRAKLDSKVLIKRLLKNLRPHSTKRVIEALQEAGTPEQKLTRTCVASFHAMLVDISKTNKKALDFGFATASRPPKNLALLSAPKSTGKSKTKFGGKPTEKSAAAIAEQGCKNHGKGAYHGTSECFIERADLAPEGFDREAALENIKRNKARRAKLRAKVKLARTSTARSAKVNNAIESDLGSDLDEEEVNAFAFVSGRAYSARSSYNTGDPFAFLGESSTDSCSTDDANETSHQVINPLTEEHQARQHLALHAECTRELYTNLSVPNDVCSSVHLCYWLEPQWVWDNVCAKWCPITGPHGHYYGYDAGRRHSSLVLPGQCVSVADEMPKKRPTVDTVRHVRGARELWICSAVTQLPSLNRLNGAPSAQEARVRNGLMTNHVLNPIFVLWVLRAWGGEIHRHPMNVGVIRSLTTLSLMGRPLGLPNVPCPVYDIDLLAEKHDDISGSDARNNGDSYDPFFREPDDYHQNTSASNNLADNDDSRPPSQVSSSPAVDSLTSQPEDMTNYDLPGLLSASSEDDDEVDYNDDGDDYDYDSDLLDFERLAFLSNAHSIRQRLLLQNNLQARRQFSNPKGKEPLPSLLMPLPNTLTCPCSLGMTKRGPRSLRHYDLPTCTSSPTFAATTDRAGSDFVWDSGASRHLCPSAKLLLGRKRTQVAHIVDIAGNQSPVSCVGSLGALSNVLVVPAATETLVSVGAFLDQHGGTLQFTGKHVLYHASEASKRQLVGRRREDGLYLTCNLPAAPPKAFLGKKQIQFQLLRERIHALHRCFGHATRERMRTILTNNSIAGISPHHVSLLTSCDSCSVGKARKASA